MFQITKPSHLKSQNIEMNWCTRVRWRERVGWGEEGAWLKSIPTKYVCDGCFFHWYLTCCTLAVSTSFSQYAHDTFQNALSRLTITKKKTDGEIERESVCVLNHTREQWTPNNEGVNRNRTKRATNTFDGQTEREMTMKERGKNAFTIRIRNSIVQNASIPNINADAQNTHFNVLPFT